MSGGDVLALSFASPRYMAVIELDPVDNADVVYSAVPELRVTVFNKVVPSEMFTLPVGVPADDETVTANVTGFPDTEGFTDEVRAVTVLFLFIT